ncbi:MULTISPECIES: DUF2244 domain-containing protein [unclassified Iodidimonas]|jgi:uncharacterized membrane protein|uniref:DUF2244 domain-containing protein n=1 Tax=unclassified Iodidimonas TaxID=2626145 RepID=UPI002482A47B|nr:MULTISPECIES: DUF2244 domain-containing protein [unclassified Iodidimonas]
MTSQSVPDPVYSTGCSGQASGPLWFHATVRPHRSLDRRHFVLIFMGLLALSALAALRFWFLGAWPVAAFFIVDALLIWGAFRLSYAHARSFETIALLEDALIITKTSWRGKTDRHQFDPYWVRIAITDPPSPERRQAATPRLYLQERGQSLEVGEALSPQERLSLGEALKTALATKKAGHPPL